MTLLLTTVFAALAVLTWVLDAVLLAHPGARRVARPHLVGMASAITGTATMGSLHLSEVAGYVPCDLCWAQRTAMYPLAVITTVALLRRRIDVWTWAVPLAAGGLALSVWHSVLQRLPVGAGTCDPTNPCSAIWVERFGVVTIPVMAGSGFLAVLVLAWVASRADRPFPSVDGTHDAQAHDAQAHDDRAHDDVHRDHAAGDPADDPDGGRATPPFPQTPLTTPLETP